jgi:hypothetical protein
MVMIMERSPLWPVSKLISSMRTEILGPTNLLSPLAFIVALLTMQFVAASMAAVVAALFTLAAAALNKYRPLVSRRPIT